MSIQINKNYYEYSFQLQQFKKSIFLMKETYYSHHKTKRLCKPTQ